MDFDTLMAAGILGFGVINAVALAGVLVSIRPGKRRPDDLGVWEVRGAPKLRIVASRPDPAELTA